MRSDDRRRVVAAVVAPADKPLVALHFLAEGVLTAGEDDAHDAVVARTEDGDKCGMGCGMGSLRSYV